MPGLALDAIDRHVVAGRGDELCVVGAEISVTYIDLLAHTAALGGGLLRLGAVDDGGIDLDIAPDWERLSYLLALVRLGLAPDQSSLIRVTGSPALLLVGEDSLPLETVVKIGRIDPVPASNFDDSHLLDRLVPTDHAWLSALLSGATITFD